MEGPNIAGIRVQNIGGPVPSNFCGCCTYAISTGLNSIHSLLSGICVKVVVGVTLC